MTECVVPDCAGHILLARAVLHGQQHIIAQLNRIQLAEETILARNWPTRWPTRAVSRQRCRTSWTPSTRPSPLPTSPCPPRRRRLRSRRPVHEVLSAGVVGHGGAS